MLTRRQFARGLALTVAGLLVPAPLAAAAEEPTRRLWALDGSMLGAGDADDLITAAQFAEGAGRVIALLEQATKDFAVLLSTDPATVAAMIARIERETLDRFIVSVDALPGMTYTITMAADPWPSARRYPTRLAAKGAYTRPAYRRRAA